MDMFNYFYKNLHLLSIWAHFVLCLTIEFQQSRVCATHVCVITHSPPLWSWTPKDISSDVEDKNLTMSTTLVAPIFSLRQLIELELFIFSHYSTMSNCCLKFVWYKGLLSSHAYQIKWYMCHYQDRGNDRFFDSHLFYHDTDICSVQTVYCTSAERQGWIVWTQLLRFWNDSNYLNHWSSQ